VAVRAQHRSRAHLHCRSDGGAMVEGDNKQIRPAAVKRPPLIVTLAAFALLSIVIWAAIILLALAARHY
jgi:hypothetical protein